LISCSIIDYIITLETPSVKRYYIFANNNSAYQHRSVFVKLGLFVSGINFGISIATIIQTLILSAIFSYALVFIRQMNKNKIITLLVFSFFAFIPFNSLNA
jgi:CBS domain containing-hemolysin-like protein